MLNAINAGKDKPFEDLPQGTVFTIHSISYADVLMLKPINKKIEDCMNTNVIISMLNFAFTASETVSVPLSELNK